MNHLAQQFYLNGVQVTYEQPISKRDKYEKERASDQWFSENSYLRSVGKGMSHADALKKACRVPDVLIWYTAVEGGQSIRSVALQSGKISPTHLQRIIWRIRNAIRKA